jgi:hypothetical protein
MYIIIMQPPIWLPSHRVRFDVLIAMDMKGRRIVFWDEAVVSGEGLETVRTLIFFYQTTRNYIPEGSTLLIVCPSIYPGHLLTNIIIYCHVCE